MNILEVGDEVRLVRDIAIPMRDGVHLAADLYVPGDRRSSRRPAVADPAGGHGLPAVPQDEPIPRNDSDDRPPRRRDE